MKKKNPNIIIVEGFGDEWEQFDQSNLNPAEARNLFNSYFSIFPWDKLPVKATGFDLGCGSGRWAKFIAPRVGHLHCIDPSSALKVAKRNLRDFNNCEFHSASVIDMPIADVSMDFGYALGVLHHIQDTQAAMSACVRKLKPGAPFLVYLYYAFDNRPIWYRILWRFSEILRYGISRMPYVFRYMVSQLLAGFVYFPLAKIASFFEMRGFDVRDFPLSAYRNLSFYTMRTDALDRFGTRLERRFTRLEIKEMMQKAGLEQIEFSPNLPFWCAVGYSSHFESSNI